MRQLHPVMGWIAACGHGFLIRGFRHPAALLFLHARGNISGQRGVMLGDVVGLLPGFVLVAAKKTRSFQIEFAQVGAGLQIVGVQRHGAFEFRLYLARQAERRERVGIFRLAAHGPAQPQMIVAVLGLQRDSLFRHAYGVVP